ncbi:MAG: aminotransferase class III-fold pyridoxal phosphate-dependent enzyme, partial [Alphaproteobacteria bacterium]|nr:aminotransferase class III-fold pyridoxal phosphate-dependent enzyme [Alphaproteobacteria bacterium]
RSARAAYDDMQGDAAHDHDHGHDHDRGHGDDVAHDHAATHRREHEAGAEHYFEPPEGDQAGVSPDILCLAKGLTGGGLPLAATLCTPEIFEAHYSLDRRRTFFHSSSFTANPIACAAARANMEIWRDEPVMERIAALGEMQEGRLERFRGDSHFSNIRRQGTIAALDLTVADPGYLAGIGPRLTAFFLDQGILLRPLGNTIYIMPPYGIAAAELDLVYDAITAAGEKFK